MNIKDAIKKLSQYDIEKLIDPITLEIIFADSDATSKDYLTEI